MIRNFFLSKPIAFKLYFYLVRAFRGDKVRLPAKGDQLYFDGYPRSGNTYDVGLISDLVPGLVWAHHLHSEAALKIALKLGIKTVVIIRNPLQAVSSFIYTKNKAATTEEIEALVQRYTKYYSFVKEKMNDLTLLSFESLTNNTAGFVTQVFSVLELESGLSQQQLNNSILNYRHRMKLAEKNKTTESSSLPNKERDIFKGKIEDEVLNSKSFEAASGLFNELTSRII
ncbi:sulfotransferase domain-containing protein [uncultured Imperialibacter sp.]|uniref:sulfotransferase domain-containing protein n=1 Tax=uncultured Imperialibacter sp. TaxID=1672639 RepID=UPI0030D7A2E8|tara:strand:+ start:23487 stop:24170 length:684 start_codon:yes stop_codon:yes gene_type:complete